MQSVEQAAKARVIEILDEELQNVACTWRNTEPQWESMRLQLWTEITVLKQLRKRIEAEV